MGLVSDVGYGLATPVAVAFVTKSLHEVYNIAWASAFLLAINAVAFGVYSFDKIFVKPLKLLRIRVPEYVLIWLLAFPGGTFGAVIAMFANDHKTGPDTREFRLELLAALAIQFILVVVLLYLALVRRQISREDLDRYVNIAMNVVLALAQKALDWFGASGLWEQLENWPATLGVK